jgi:hypothetical protein
VDVGRGVKDDVLGSDAIGGVPGGGGRDGLDAVEALDVDALVHAQDTRHIVLQLQLGVGVHG